MCVIHWAVIRNTGNTVSTEYGTFENKDHLNLVESAIEKMLIRHNCEVVHIAPRPYYRKQ